ncbi:MAG: hypothetical protein A3J75_03485, partial [Acidobacteria bacterium RBG_16_68_9]
MPEAQAHEFTTEIAASPLNCFKTITDFESYPRWSSAIEHAAIIERDRIGLGRVVEYHIDMRFKRIRYVLEYAYRKPEELTWRAVDGDIEFIEGSYHLRKLAPKLTAVTCRQAVSLGFWVPGPFRKLLERTALR